MIGSLVVLGLLVPATAPAPPSPAPQPTLPVISIRCTTRAPDAPNALLAIACEVSGEGRSTTFGRIQTPDASQLDFMATDRGDLVTALRRKVGGATTPLSFWSNGACSGFMFEGIDDPAMTERTLRQLVEELPKGLLRDLSVLEMQAREGGPGNVSAMRGMFGGALQPFVTASGEPVGARPTVKVEAVGGAAPHRLDVLWDRLMVRLHAGVTSLDQAIAALETGGWLRGPTAGPEGSPGEPPKATPTPGDPGKAEPKSDEAHTERPSPAETPKPISPPSQLDVEPEAGVGAHADPIPAASRAGWMVLLAAVALLGWWLLGARRG